jgi:Zn-dependent M28 family amino/carboxypeptidase
VVVESKILLNYYPTHSLLETYHQAAAGGALAFIAWVDAPYELLPRYNHLKEDEPAGAIPGLLLARGDGLLLDHLLEQFPDQVELDIHMTSREWPAQTGDVVGYLPGADDIVIVGSHYDSVCAGAVDNAAANAGLIALAMHAASFAQPRPTLVFCAHPGHEVNVGAREFVANHPDLIKRAYAYVSLDGFGSTGFSWEAAGVTPTGSDEKRGISVSENPLLLKIAVEAVKQYNLLPAAYVPAADIIFNKDLEGRFYDLGIPILMIIGKPIWYHTFADTPDKITPDQLLRSFQAHAEILGGIIHAGADQIRKKDRRPYEDVLSQVAAGQTKTAGWEQGRSASFGFIPEPAAVGEPTLFFISDFSNPDEVIVKVKWDFGDGHTARGPVSFNVYEKPGRYTVQLVLTDAGGYRSVYERVLWAQ